MEDNRANAVITTAFVLGLVWVFVPTPADRLKEALKEPPAPRKERLEFNLPPDFGVPHLVGPGVVDLRDPDLVWEHLGPAYFWKSESDEGDAFLSWWELQSPGHFADENGRMQGHFDSGDSSRMMATMRERGLTLKEFDAFNP